MAEVVQASDGAAGEGPSAALLTVSSVAIGALVANLYYAQPLLAQIAASDNAQRKLLKKKLTPRLKRLLYGESA